MHDERTEAPARWDRDRQPEPRSGVSMARVVIGAIVVAGLYFARPVLEPIALAVLLSLMLAPAVRWLHLRGIGRSLAVFATVLLAFVVIAGFGAAIGDEVIGFIQKLPQYEDNLAAKIRSLNGVVPGAGMLGRATQVFHDLGSELQGAVGPTPPSTGLPNQPAPVPVEIHRNEPALLQFLSNVVGPMLQPLAEAALVVLFVIMILLKREDLRDRILRLAGARDLHRTTAAMNEAAARVSNYLLMQLAVGLCYGVMVGIGLAVIGIPNAPLWGVMGVLLRFVPYIGGPLTALLPCTLAIAVSPGWGVFFWTVLLFIAVETVTANFIEPWIYGRTTGLSSVAVIAAATFWTWLWGPVGLLLATPLTVCFAVLGRYLPPLRFLDILLGNQPVLSLQESFYQRLLARDPEEATEQAEEVAKEKSIEAFFDEIAIPALVLAQADSDRGVLAGHRRAVIAEGFAAILDNLADDGLVEAESAEGEGPPIACIAARNELDLAAAWLLQHLLRLRGHRAVVFSPDALSTFNIDRLPLRGAAVVCLSMVSTTSPARARYLVRRIRRRARRAHLIIGLWGPELADFPIADAAVATAADTVVTTLAAALADIEAALAEAAPPPERSAERLTRQSA
ncbi:MAG: AI-2E family transporter [Alphaproteobacteria bacterium]|nr:AI-2E family transporter [Alphaproteobacteria bacterium]